MTSDTRKACPTEYVTGADAGHEDTATACALPARHLFPAAGPALSSTAHLGMVPISGAQRFLDRSTLPPSGSPDQATLLALAQAHGCPRAVGRVTHRSQLVEAGEELVEGHDQLLGRALRRQAGEALDVSKQDAGEIGGGGTREGGRSRGHSRAHHQPQDGCRPARVLG